MEVGKLRERFSYDPVSGLLTWKVRPKFSSIAIGTVAGNLHRHRNTVYRRVMVDGESIYAHQIAWAITYGEWPTFRIDHEDRDGLNNSIRNLRSVTNSENLHNAKIYSTNKSGVKGVCFNKGKGMWQAYIYMDCKQFHLGWFTSLEVAASARAKAEDEMIGGVL